MNHLFTTGSSQQCTQKLHWRQRLALIRHNLHMAALTQNFSFFKELQALQLVSGIDHIAGLTRTLEAGCEGTDEDREDLADSLILSLDKLNAVVACVHEDAFRKVYDTVRDIVSDDAICLSDRKAMYFASVATERKTAAESIDKMFNSATDAISGQPREAQEQATCVFIVGTVFIADAIEVCFSYMDRIEDSLDDSFRLDAYWSTVQGAVATAMSGMKGVFKLMDQSPSTPQSADISPSDAQGEDANSRTSFDGYAKSMFRRMSTAFAGPSSTYAPSNAGSDGGRVVSATLPSRKASVASSFISAPSRRSSVAPPSRRSSVASQGSSSGSRSSVASQGGSSGNVNRTRNISNTSLSGFAQSMPFHHNGQGPSTNHSQTLKNRHSGMTHTMSPIPSTPATEGVNGRANPFDATFAITMAFSSNNVCRTPTSLNPDTTPTSMAYGSKHFRAQSRAQELQLYDDDDICPTTPTPQKHYNTPGFTSAAAGVSPSVPGGQDGSRRSPLRSSVGNGVPQGAVAGPLASLASVTSGAFTGITSASPRTPTTTSFPGSRRRSVNVNGDRPCGSLSSAGEFEGGDRLVMGLEELV